MKTKSDYKKAFDLVTSVINEWDPYYLIKQGCPNDEFDAEVGDILPRIKEMKDSDDCVRVVSEVFKKWFSAKEIDEEECSDVGIKLYNTLHSHGFIETNNP